MRMKLAAIVLVALLLAQLVFAAGPVSSDFTHVVQQGETLYSIALRYGVSVQALMNANGIYNPNLIYVGQRLTIPTGTSSGQPATGSVVYIVRRGDILASIAWRYGVTVSAIVQANGIRNPNLIYVGQRLIIPGTAPAQPSQPGRHVVRRGETLSAIAWRYGVSMWQIVAANGLRNPNFIYVGQVLIIPGVSPAPKPHPKPTSSGSQPPPATPQPGQPSVKVWVAHVLSNTNQDQPVLGVGSTLQVSVRGKVGLPVKVSLDGYYETTMPTGSKPEVGPYGCEFAPLQAGTWTITPEGLGTSFDIYLDGAGLASVEFYRTEGGGPQPTPKPGEPTPKPAPPIGGRMQSPAYGMQAFLWWRPETADRDLQLIQQAGFGWVKQIFAWREIEGAGKGKYDWSRADRVVNQAQKYGLRILARVDSQPKWAGGGFPTNGPPNNLQDYADFLKALATRYKGRIQAYQIWNEPNLKREWGNQAPNPAAYTNMLKRAYSAVKSADPKAWVITAGLAPTTRWDSVAMPDTEFVKGMYDAGVKGYFDALGVHAAGYKAPPEMDPAQVATDANYYNKGDPNCPGSRCRIYCFRHVEDLRQIMVNRGDGNRQIVILEFGWTIDPRPGSAYHWHAVSEQQQGDYLVRAYQYAKAHWSPWIGLMSLIYMPNPDWTSDQEQYWWAIIEPSYPELHLRPAYVMLKNMAK
jgi:polysaccharide biosynthesis protein PslG